MLYLILILICYSQSALRAAYAERDAQVPEFCRVGISPLVEDLQPLDLPQPDNGTPEASGGLGRLEQELGLLRLEPQLLRPPPPLLDSRDEEVIWLNPHSENSFDVLWDHSMCADNVKGAEVRELMCKAFRGPLVPGQQQQVPARHIDEGVEFCRRSHLCPSVIRCSRSWRVMRSWSTTAG